jgi:hypothetical protein
MCFVRSIHFESLFQKNEKQNEIACAAWYDSGKLPRIEDANFNNEVFNVCPFSWINMQRRNATKESVWFWFDNRTDIVQRYFWNVNEPDFYMQREFCARFFPESGPKWVDTPCVSTVIPPPSGPDCATCVNIITDNDTAQLVNKTASAGCANKVCFHRLSFIGQRSWSEAMDDCRRWDFRATLPTILDTDTDERVGKLCNTTVWIGLKRTVNATYSWPNGSPSASFKRPFSTTKSCILITAEGTWVSVIFKKRLCDCPFQLKTQQSEDCDAKVARCVVCTKSVTPRNTAIVQTTLSTARTSSRTTTTTTMTIRTGTQNPSTQTLPPFDSPTTLSATLPMSTTSTTETISTSSSETISSAMTPSSMQEFPVAAIVALGLVGVSFVVLIVFVVVVVVMRNRRQQPAIVNFPAATPAATTTVTTQQSESARNQSQYGTVMFTKGEEAYAETSLTGHIQY